jgi:hypothetical protein
MGVNFTQCSSWRILIDNDTIEECGDLYQINEGGWIYRADVCDLRADDLRAVLGSRFSCRWAFDGEMIARFCVLKRRALDPGRAPAPQTPTP